uniref:TSC22 domain family member 3 n=2 Tax=Durocryptodira TaxID=1579337 RepID=A0A8C4WDW5_9SAUR
MASEECRSPVGLDCCSCCLDLANRSGLEEGAGGENNNLGSPTVSNFRQLRAQLVCENLNADKLSSIMRQDSLEPVVRDPCYLLNQGICNSNIDQTLLSILLFFHRSLSAHLPCVPRPAHGRHRQPPARPADPERREPASPARRGPGHEHRALPVRHGGGRVPTAQLLHLLLLLAAWRGRGLRQTGQQRLRSQRGGYRQQDRAGDGSSEKPPDVCCAGGGGDPQRADQRAGGEELPAGAREQPLENAGQP